MLPHVDVLASGSLPEAVVDRPVPAVVVRAGRVIARDGRLVRDGQFGREASGPSVSCISSRTRRATANAEFAAGTPQ